MLRAVLSSVTAPPREQRPEVATLPPAASPPAPEQGARESWWRRVPWWRIAPVLASAIGAVVYVILAPRSVDLATHVFRADLFGREGFTIWNGSWYGGHHTPAYSVLSPPLAWLVGPRALLILCGLACAALFEPSCATTSARRRSRWGAIWFGAGTTTLLFTSRLPFAHRHGARPGVRARAPARAPRGSRGCSRCSARSAARWRACSWPWATLAYALAARGEGSGARRRRGLAPGRRGAPAAGLPVGRLPRGRLRAVPDQRLHTDPALRARLPGHPPQGRADAEAGRGAVRARRRPWRWPSRRRWAATRCGSGRSSADRCC